jgi:NADH-quinone oxidoreductase subunit J
MFLFVIAYLGGRAATPWAGGPSLNRMAAVVAAVAILVEVLVAIGLSSGDTSHAASISGSFGSPAEIGRLFLTDQLLAFEITSVVLLIAAVGGVVLGAHARRLQADSDEPPPPHIDESPVEIPAAQ